MQNMIVETNTEANAMMPASTIHAAHMSNPAEQIREALSMFARTVPLRAAC